MKNTPSPSVRRWLAGVLCLSLFAATGRADDVEVLVVGGGGGGGGNGATGSSAAAYGGGGAGGVLYNTAYSVTQGTGITVVVGSGGAADTTGGNSSFGTMIALGGGRGGSPSYAPGSGGSGGGGNYPNGGYLTSSSSGNPGTGTSGQGNGGGWGYTDGVTYGVGGGGGGAGGAGGGQITTGNPAGTGGVGVSHSISGTATYYGGGGGGGGDHRQSYATGGSGGNGGGGAGATTNAGTGTSGAANTGGGGGGGAYNGTGGAGGSGIVIVCYSGTPKATGGTITQSGGYTTHTFTSGGTFTLTESMVTLTPTGTTKAIINGNVGIGTTNPTYPLAVNGTIRAKEIIVDTGWADFVFADDYRLPSLAEVEAHIAAHGRLPGLPSEAQVAKEGVSLGDMQTRLLQKIEELTLHQIAQEKRLNEQAARIATLEAENARLRTR